MPRKPARSHPASSAVQRHASIPRRPLTSELPPLDPYLSALWEEGARQARALKRRETAPCAVLVTAQELQRLTELCAHTGAAQQQLLNKAVAAAWQELQRLQVNIQQRATSLSGSADQLVHRLVLRPWQSTAQQIFEADHPQAAALLVRIGLSLLPLE